MKSRRGPFESANILAGRNPVREALERGDVSFEKLLLLQGGRGLDEFRKLATSQGLPFQFVPQAKLDAMAPGVNHQGVVALVSAASYVDVDDMLSDIAADIDAVRQEKPIIVILDQIEDPHNFGAILRSSVAAGVRGAIVPVHHSAPLSTVAIKASAGAALRIPIARVTNIADTIEDLKERGYWIVGAAGEGATSMWEMDWDRPLAMVIGNEGSGLRPRVRDGCDYLVNIPILGPVESLNASVAAGVLLFVATRGRAISP